MIYRLTSRWVGGACGIVVMIYRLISRRVGGACGIVMYDRFVREGSVGFNHQ